MNKGKIISIVGHPNEGKTMSAIIMATSEAKAGNPSLYFSLDVGAESFSAKLIRSMNSSFADGSITVDHTAGIETGALLSKVETAKKEKGVRNVFIDYGELVDAFLDKPYDEQQEDLFSSLREFSAVNGVNFIVLCQARKKRRGKEDEWYTVKCIPSKAVLKYSDRIYFVRPGIEVPELELIYDNSRLA